MTTLLGLALLLTRFSPSAPAITAGLAPELPKALSGVHRIVCMGDSITAAGDSDDGHGYVKLIRQSLAKLFPEAGIEVVNVGIGGQRAPDMLGRWQRDVIDKHPDLVTLSVGINDVWHGFYDNHPAGDGPKGVALDVYIADVKQMIETAQANKIRVVLVSPTVITEDSRKLENQKLQGYVEAERKLARDKRVPFVDLHDAFIKKLSTLREGPDDSTLRLTVDGVHMQTAGDRLMAFNILRKLGIKASDLAEISPDRPRR
jgi:lysophospholipase L1-like esterase